MFRKIFHGLTGRLDHILASHGHTFAMSKELLERSLFLNGQIAAMQVRQREQIKTLADVEFRVTSQWGEDGIIEWLCHKLPNIDRSFVEFGVENFGEANTRFLLQNRGWRGLVLDGNSAHMDYVRSEAIHWKHDLVAESAFITAENINDLITRNGFAGELGILSVDIDGNDYWVLKAIASVNPAILIAEINGVLGDHHSITVPYDPSFRRLSAHHSGQYFGASIKAMISLAEERGYAFVGTNSTGVNAFFVRSDLAGPVLSSIETIKAWPARHRDSRDVSGALTFARGPAKIDLIKDLPVYDLERDIIVPIESLLPLYSDAWAREM
ncbi:hypothetical protein [Filomicrobium sp.]|uniref:hypothetical protein n=1 Tax=Filomicrobium sp. TaxID=2024831 RepID=UPI0025861384|nr:hypothetical protein [Filomicrobium sp.]MCV0371353.1 hypothetical protein [Filomicrobium sp.]